MDFPILPSTMDTLLIDDLFSAKKMSKILYNKLSVTARLKTIGELYEQYCSADDFVTRVPYAGKRVGIELNKLLLCLSDYDESEVDDFTAEVDSSVFPEFDPAILKITFESLKSQNLISNTIYNRTVRDSGLLCIGDLTTNYCSINKFLQSTSSSGKGTYVKFENFMRSLVDNPSPFLKAFQLETGIYLPYNYTPDVPTPIGLKRLLIDSIKELKIISSNSKGKSKVGNVAEQLFIENLNNEEIGLVTNITSERARQLSIKIKKSFQEWFFNNQNQYLPKFYINLILRDRINDVIVELRTELGSIGSVLEVDEWLSSKEFMYTKEDTIAWHFFLDMASVYKLGKVDNSFTNTDFYIIDPDFDKKAFCRIGKYTLDALRDNVVPIEKQELVRIVKDSLKQCADSGLKCNSLL